MDEVKMRLARCGLAFSLVLALISVLEKSAYVGFTNLSGSHTSGNDHRSISIGEDITKVIRLLNP